MADLEHLTAYERKCERLAEKWREALTTSDVVRFFHLTDEGGFSLKTEAEKNLYERGQAETEFIGKQKRVVSSEDLKQRDYWARIARIALRRFPELQEREHILVSEIKGRLRELKEAGYSVQPYSGMKAEEAWRYLSQIRRGVYNQTKIYCPYVLAEIERRNEQQKREAREFR